MSQDVPNIFTSLETTWDWNQAKIVVDYLNGDMHPYDGPMWSWDCGFKLDYDGPIVAVSSRFWPPHGMPSNRKWDGTVHINLLGNSIADIEIEASSLEELTTKTKRIVEEAINRITVVLNGIDLTNLATTIAT